MPTNRRKLVRERRQHLSQEALAAYLAKDEPRLRRALGLGPHQYTPMPVKGGYAIDAGRSWDATPNNSLYSEAYAQFEMLEQAAKQYRAQQRAAAKATKRRVK